MSSLETVYAVHNFEAENDDELTFQIGEPIIIIQKDDGFNDGWWKGQNMRGEVGIFPMNYITLDPPSNQLIELPTPSNSDSFHNTKKPSHINTSILKDRFDVSPSVRTSYSFTCPISSSPARRSANSSNNSSPISNNSVRRLIINALFLPHLRSTAPRDWDVDQVETWLNAMNFGALGEHFKSQEITGDILLELNMESLKELDVPTFGKRFRLHGAIMALRDECGMQPSNNHRNRLSMTSSSYSDDHHRQRSSSHSPSSARYSSPMYAKNSFSYHSSLTNADKYQRKSYHSGIKENCEEDQRSHKSPARSAPATPSSTYDIMEANKQHYENRQYDNMPNSSSRRDMAFLQQTQKQQTILPMARRSSMDIYSGGRQDDHTNVTPDMEGWLFKQGCKYKKWNKRWFVLKGPNLFYFKSPKDVRMKGIINLRGYRIIPDETIQPGKYSFKAQHEDERTFYFYTDVDTSMKAWISSLMKATISRDFNAPVLSSSMIPTVSLDVARRMRPRPPSVLLYKKEKKDLGYQTPISEKSSASSSSTSNRESAKEDTLNQDSGFDSNDQEEEDNQPDSHSQHQEEMEEEEEEDNEEEDEEVEHLFNETEPQETTSWTATDYIQWINTISCSAGITRLQELRQGDVLIEILEELSGKPVRQLPTTTVGSISMLMLDNIVAVFKFMSVEGIEIGDKFTIKDIYGGNEEKIQLMLESILKWSIRLVDDF